MPISGVVGQIKWAYYNAAAINGYRVTRAGRSWWLEGTIVTSDAFKMAQRPLVFVAPHRRPDGTAGEWRWPIEELTVHDGEVTARLGTPEAR